jgi:membrane-bound serine protease (ClpP class)
MSGLVSLRWWRQPGGWGQSNRGRQTLLALAVLLVAAPPLLAGPLAEAVARARTAAGVEQPAAAATKPNPGRPNATIPPKDAADQKAAPAGAAPAVVSLSVPLPLSGNRDTQLRSAILRQLEQLASQPDRRGLLVLQFTVANPETAGASDFARSLALARFLTAPELARVKTVAFLPKGASGHAVLVALACEEIVMAPDAVLGPANLAETRVDEAMRVAYREIAAHRRTVPPPLAVALVDPDSQIVRASTEAGEQIIAAAQLPQLRQQVQVLGVEELGPAPLELTGRQGRELGVVRLLASSPLELATALDLDPAKLRIDPSLEQGWQAAVVSLAGPVTAPTVARAQSQLNEALTSGANFLCLEIDSPGGTPEQSLVLARWLAEQDAGLVRTVAYVPQQARGDAALIALACDELVMQEDAVLGGEGAAAISPRQAEALAVAWREAVAGRDARPWSLPLALVLPEYAVSRMVQQMSGRMEYFSEEERQARDDRDAWQVKAALPVGPLALNAAEAEDYGLAEPAVESFGELASRYGLGENVELIEPGWAVRLLDALASPGLAWLLLLIGGAGLYIELQTPGLGFGGFIAMVAFLVYFWSQYLNGTSGWLEVMLFLAGLVCLAAEVFVVPGIGVLGLGGGLLLITSLVLASQSFVVPGNAYQFRQVQWSLLGILGAGLGVGVFGVLVRRWLPSTPVLRHVLLIPPEPEPQPAAESLENLIGTNGITTTRLAPAGQAEVAGRLRDVWSEGMLIEPGTAIRVSAVRAGRVLVLPESAEETP